MFDARFGIYIAQNDNEHVVINIFACSESKHTPYAHCMNKDRVYVCMCSSQGEREHHLLYIVLNMWFSCIYLFLFLGSQQQQIVNSN